MAIDTGVNALTVADLMEELSKLPPEMLVVTYEQDFSEWYNVSGVEVGFCWVSEHSSETALVAYFETNNHLS